MFTKDKQLHQDKSPHSPHSIIPNLITPNTTILDIGCNAGYLGKTLKSKKVTCDGIDINKKLLSIADKYYRHTYQRDLNNPILNLNPKFNYDYIILSDILEHLPRPDLLLIEIKKYLKKGGKIIISLPNIARLEIRLKLLFGKFEYSPGILSEDHLRFFTKNSAEKMFQQCCYKIEKIIPTGLGHKIKIFPTLTAFQFIYILS